MARLEAPPSEGADRLPMAGRLEYTEKMPNLLRVKGYRFFFFSLEGQEPPHVHVEQAERYAKFWLEPVRLARNKGFRSRELSEICDLIEEHREGFLEKWHERHERQG